MGSSTRHDNIYQPTFRPVCTGTEFERVNFEQKPYSFQYCRFLKYVSSSVSTPDHETAFTIEDLLNLVQQATLLVVKS